MTQCRFTCSAYIHPFVLTDSASLNHSLVYVNEVKYDLFSICYMHYFLFMLELGNKLDSVSSHLPPPCSRAQRYTQAVLSVSLRN